MNDIGAEVGRIAGEAALIVKDRTGKALTSPKSLAVIVVGAAETGRINVEATV